MVLDEKREVILFVVAILVLLVVGSYVGLTGNATQGRYSANSYYCYDSDGFSTLTKGTVTYRNSGPLAVNKTDYCVEEGAVGGLVHEYWCDGNTMQQSNFACAWTQRCVDGRCIDNV